MGMRTRPTIEEEIVGLRIALGSILDKGARTNLMAQILNVELLLDVREQLKPKKRGRPPKVKFTSAN